MNNINHEIENITGKVMPTKHQRYDAFCFDLEDKIMGFAKQSPEAALVALGQVPERISKPGEGDEVLYDLVYRQPPNRQYYRRAFKENERAGRTNERKSYQDSITTKPEKDPTKLHPALIREIFKKNHVSIHHKQHAIGMVKVTDANGTSMQRSWPLLDKILKKRGKKRQARIAMSRESAKANRAA